MDDYNQKLNAISRLVILLSVVGLLVTKSVKFFIIGLITLGGIFIISKQRNPSVGEEGLKVMLKETNKDTTADVAKKKRS
jgi:hypothetical protein